MQMLVHFELLYLVVVQKLFISIVLMLNTFLRKLKNLLDIKTSRQTFFKNNQTILYCVDIFALDLLILCLLVKLYFTDMFSPYDFKTNDVIILSYFKDEWNGQNKLDSSNKTSIKWNQWDWKFFEPIK